MLKFSALQINGHATGLRAALAAGFHERLRGLLLRESWSSFDVLCLLPCRAIHTAGVHRPFDLVFADSAGRVLQCHSRVPPWHFRTCRGAGSAWEMRAGLVTQLRLAAGDRLEARFGP
jgi:uncharacterized protein